MDFFSGIFSQNWYEKLIKQAKKNAASEGQYGRPAPSSSTPDSYELNFISEGSTLILKANSKVTEFIKKTSPVIEEAKSKLEDLDAEARSKIDLEALANKIHAKKNDSRLVLTNSHLKIIETEGYLNSFKASHNVKHIADYPEDVMHFLSIIFIVLVVEGVLNAFFWKNSSGLVGGFFQAIIIAAVNIGFAMLVGMLVRYVHYKKTWALALSVSSMIFGALGIYWLNLKIATERSMHHLNKITTSDFSSVFQDFSSGLLFFVGLFFAILAVYKGYYLFGSMPGYQKVSKDFDTATSETSFKIKALKEDIESEILIESNRLKKILRSLTEASKTLNRIKAEVRSSKENFNATASEIAEYTKLLVKTYREINSRSRPSNIPTPEYFNEEVNIDFEIITSFASLEQSVVEASENADEMFKNISEEINEDLSVLDKFRASELGPVIENYINEIRNDAKERFISSIATFQRG